MIFRVILGFAFAALPFRLSAQEAAAPAPAAAAPKSTEAAKGAPTPSESKAAPAPKAKKKRPAKAKVKRTPRPVESRYKSRLLNESVEHTYRFDEKGNPITHERKKKPGKAKKVSSEASSEASETSDQRSEDGGVAEENKGDQPSCASDDSCGEKIPEAAAP